MIWREPGDQPISGKVQRGGGRVILIEHGPGGEPALFDHPREVIAARTPAEVAVALRRAEAARVSGAWVAGYVAYEAGYVLEPRLAV